jgi:hypothetical protein
VTWLNWAVSLVLSDYGDCARGDARAWIATVVTADIGASDGLYGPTFSSGTRTSKSFGRWNSSSEIIIGELLNVTTSVFVSRRWFAEYYYLSRHTTSAIFTQVEAQRCGSTLSERSYA